MKRSKAETAATRKRIVEAAAQKFACNGIHATGLSDVMAEAGLTHGGFYRHFQSKDQLVAEACVVGLGALAASSEATAERGGAEEAFKSFAESYLSAEHRNNRAGGCPLAALGSELARAEGRTRTAASDAFEHLVDAIMQRLTDRSPEESRAEAAYAVSAMVGALTMSRLVEDPELSDAILREARKRLMAG